jgi:TolB protein
MRQNKSENKENKKELIVFHSQKKIGLINEDGTGERYLEVDIPHEMGIGCSSIFPADRRSLILTSIESGKTWEGDGYTRVWRYDIFDGTLTELLTKNRLANTMFLVGFLPDGRALVSFSIDREERLFSADIDGGNQREITKKGEGYTYGTTLSPAGDKLAFHAVGGGRSYSIYVTNPDGSDRICVATDPDYIFFGPSWSPDGEWLTFLGCLHKQDPAHNWADIFVCRPDGSELRAVTSGQSHWFATSHGTPGTRGNGSNVVSWSANGGYLYYTKAKPGSVTAWEFQPDRPDTDHFNRDYKPENARGGSSISLLDPFSGKETPLTQYSEFVWDFRVCANKKNKKNEGILFCRARIGFPSELWLMDNDGGRQRMLTGGYQGMGTDHAYFTGIVVD